MKQYTVFLLGNRLGNQLSFGSKNYWSQWLVKINKYYEEKYICINYNLSFSDLPAYVQNAIRNSAKNELSPEYLEFYRKKCEKTA